MEFIRYIALIPLILPIGMVLILGNGIAWGGNMIISCADWCFDKMADWVFNLNQNDTF